MSLSKCRHLYAVCHCAFSSVMLVSVDVSDSVRVCLNIPLLSGFVECVRPQWHVSMCRRVCVCVCVYPGKVTLLLCLLPVSLETDCKKVSLWQGETPKTNTLQHTHAHIHTFIFLSATHSEQHITTRVMCSYLKSTCSHICVNKGEEGTIGDNHHLDNTLWACVVACMCVWVLIERSSKSSLSLHVIQRAIDPHKPSTHHTRNTCTHTYKHIIIEVLLHCCMGVVSFPLQNNITRAVSYFVKAI